MVEKMVDVMLDIGDANLSPFSKAPRLPILNYEVMSKFRRAILVDYHVQRTIDGRRSRL
jgi:hypothetical protein